MARDVSTETQPSDKHIVVDTKKCQGCLACMIVCSLVHEGEVNLPRSKIQVMQNSFDRFPNDLAVEYKTCDMCANTPFWNEQGGPDRGQACVAVCPLSAIRPATGALGEIGAGPSHANFRGKGWKILGYPTD